MDKLLVITDLHLAAPGERIIGLDPLARFRAVLKAAATAHPDAKALILLGDLTHRGDIGAYADLYRALDNLPFPVIPMLGNHDRRETFLEVFPDTALTPEGHVQAVMDFPGHRIITLDTLAGPPYRERDHAGQLCEDRLAWLKGALWGLEGRVPLVFAHHPPFPVGLQGMDAIALRDPQSLLDVLASAPGAHLFCGHIHRTIAGSHLGIPWTIFKSPCHQCPLDLNSPSSAISIDEPGAYGLILLTPGGVVVHSQDVGLNAPVHQDDGSA